MKARVNKLIQMAIAAMMITTASSSSSSSLQSCCFATRSINGIPTMTTKAQSSSGFLGRTVRFIPPAAPAVRKSSSKSTELSMFMGSDGGVLGVGAPEVALIVLVGYFVLGPTELYKLTKEIGKFIQNVRTLGVEATSSFENSMEENLQMNEIRKAQRELNDAFSFRRSINYDDEGLEAFPKEEELAAAGAGAGAAGAGAAAGAATAETSSSTTTTKKRKRKRVKKKKVVQPQEEEESYDFAAANGGGQIPDLDMTSAFENAKTPEELAREERLARLESGTQPSTPPDWFESAPEYEPMSSTAVPPPPTSPTTTESTSTAAEQERFAKQLSSSWNDQILANEDKLSPLSQIMERLAILEEERMAASARIEEEYRKKSEVEEEFYRKKKDLLEEAAVEVSTKAFAEQEAAAAEAEAAAQKEQEEEAAAVAAEEAKKEEEEEKTTDLKKDETKKEEETKKEVVSSESKE